MVIHPPMRHGIRRFLRRLCFRDSRAVGRQARCDVGALVAAVDHARLVFPHLRHRAGQLVGVLRAGLGRVVVLGSGRKRVLHAVAGRHRAHSLAGRDREARGVQELDGAARNRRLQLELAGDFSGALGRADLGSCLRYRSQTRRLYTRLPGARHRRLTAAVRLACAARGPGGAFEAVSRESALLANNVLLVVAAGSVLLGTLYPLFLDAFGLGKISVGPPYFEAVFVPLMTPAIFLMGIGPMARWKQASLPELAVRLRWALVVSVVTASLVPAVAGKWTPW